MSDFVITFRDMDHREWQYTCAQEVWLDVLLADFANRLQYEIYACRINHVVKPLHTLIRQDCTVDLLDLRDPETQRIYEASLSFVYVSAVHHVFSDQVDVVLENSLSGGVYTTIRADIDEHTDERVEQEMRRLIAADLPFRRTEMNREEMERYGTRQNLQGFLRLLASAPDYQHGVLYEMGDEAEFGYIDLVPSTGYLKYFELRRYRNGFLLRFPDGSQPQQIRPFKEEKKLYEAFAENTHWSRIVRIDKMADLNEAAADPERMKELILLNEALHASRIAEIARQIHEQQKRFILIAGPSSSGKTTFARRLCIQLQILGEEPLYLGTDDYFLERSQTPLDEDGRKDYESLQALDLDLFNRQMQDLLAGKKVDLPTYDFQKGTKIFGKRIRSLRPDQPVVIEGIHGLNPALSEQIDEAQKFRIYISPLTQLAVDDQHRIYVNDARKLRRIVRDYQFRGNSADSTLAAWDKVKKGEEENIFPYTDQADVFFNSHLIYELPVLKSYAQPQLEAIDASQETYAEAQRLLRVLSMIRPFAQSEMIPSNSIIREFIGGSILV